MHVQTHKAHVKVEGPVLVLVVMCSWQWKQVKVTGPSESSVGTTNWVATGGGALCWGPTSEKKHQIQHLWILHSFQKGTYGGSMLGVGWHHTICWYSHCASCHLHWDHGRHWTHSSLAKYTNICSNTSENQPTPNWAAKINLFFNCF